METIILFAMAILVFAMVLGITVKVVCLILEYKMRVYELVAQMKLETEDEKTNS